MLSEEDLVEIAMHLPVHSAFQYGKTSRVMHQIFSKDVESFAGSVSTQFYQTVQSLFEFEEYTADDGTTKKRMFINHLETEDLGFHIRRLIEVLRILDDHNSFGISDDFYKATVQALRTTSGNNWSLKTLPLLMGTSKNVIKNASRPIDYAVICTLIGQTLTHMDGKKRTFRFAFDEQDCTDAAYSAIFELAFHPNLAFHPMPMDAQGHEGKCAKIILEQLLVGPLRLSNPTVNRIRSFATRDNTEQSQYRAPAGLLGYALTHPGENTEFLQSFIKSDFPDGLYAMAEYLENPEADHPLMAEILYHLQHFERGVRQQNSNKIMAYANYMWRKDADPEQISRILADTHSFHEAGDKRTIYKRYFWRETIDPEQVSAILVSSRIHGLFEELYLYEHYFDRKDTADTVADAMMNGILNEDFIPQWVKLFPIYKAYIKRTTTDPELVQAILEKTKDQSELCTQLSTLYLEQGNADTDLVKALLEKASLSKDAHYRLKFYTAYLKRADADIKLMNAMLEEVHALEINASESMDSAKNAGLRIFFYAAYIKHLGATEKEITDILDRGKPLRILAIQHVVKMMKLLILKLKEVRLIRKPSMSLI